MRQIRQLADVDWPPTWAVIEPVFRAGDTYPYSRDTTMDDAYNIWVSAPAKTFVAVDDSGAILGTYYLKPSQPAQGSHVCNCGYIVSDAARGLGEASDMCRHSQREAAADGYRAMQYNLVVATNTGVAGLWHKMGFEIVGTLPGERCIRHVLTLPRNNTDLRLQRDHRPDLPSSTSKMLFNAAVPTSP